MKAKAEDARARAQRSSDTGLAALLARVAPQLQSHAQSARQLAQASAGQGGTSTGSGPGAGE